MTLRIGDEAPLFEGVDQDGKTVSLAAFLGKADVVLFFYPKDFTKVCSLEVRGFGEIYPALRERGVVLLGISTDDRESHARFAESCGTPFPLLSDPGGKIAALYGAKGILRGLLGLTKRMTFAIHREGRISAIFVGETNANAHVDGVSNLFLT